jgi:hypothetical protein
MGRSTFCDRGREGEKVVCEKVEDDTNWREGCRDRGISTE